MKRKKKNIRMILLIVAIIAVVGFIGIQQFSIIGSDGYTLIGDSSIALTEYQEGNPSVKSLSKWAPCTPLNLNSDGSAKYPDIECNKNLIYDFGGESISKYWYYVRLLDYDYHKIDYYSAPVTGGGLSGVHKLGGSDTEVYGHSSDVTWYNFQSPTSYLALLYDIKDKKFRTYITNEAWTTTTSRTDNCDITYEVILQDGTYKGTTKFGISRNIAYTASSNRDGHAYEFNWDDDNEFGTNMWQKINNQHIIHTNVNEEVRKYSGVVVEKGLLDIEPSVLNPNKIYVSFGGEPSKEYDITGWENVYMVVKQRAYSGGDDRGCNIKTTLKDTRISPVFGCTLDTNEELAFKTYEGGEEIYVDENFQMSGTPFEIKKLCYEHPAIIENLEKRGTTTTAELYNIIAGGKKYVVPKDRMVTAFFITETPTGCPDGEGYNILNGKCEDLFLVKNQLLADVLGLEKVIVELQDELEAKGVDVDKLREDIISRNLDIEQFKAELQEKNINLEDFKAQLELSGIDIVELESLLEGLEIQSAEEKRLNQIIIFVLIVIIIGFGIYVVKKKK